MTQDNDFLGHFCLWIMDNRTNKIFNDSYQLINKLGLMVFNIHVSDG